MGLLMSLYPSTGYTCSCVPPPPVEDLLGGETAIFSGTVKKITNEKREAPIQSSADQVAVLVEVDRVWQGVEDSQVTLYTAISSASCGFEFQVDTEYLIYANENEDGFDVSLCSRTAKLTDAQEDLDILGEGQTPSVDIEPDADTEANDSNRLLIWIFAGIVVIGTFVIVKRRN
jgi:hypothetical protein